MKANPPQREKALGAIDLIEEAMHLLRCAPWTTLAVHLLGGVPFLLGMLYYVADMSRGSYADQRCVSGALGLAVLYLWMKIWQTRFSNLLWAQIQRKEPSPWPVRRWLKVAMVQAVLQPTELLLLPFALVITLPFGWVYVFYQNTVLLGDGELGVRATIRRATRLSTQWPKQNHMVLLILSLFGFIIFLNTAMLVSQLPHLVKMLLGIETDFTRGGIWSVFNTTFLAVTIGVAWLLVSPIIRAVYVLRCFYAAARETGEDLRLELHSARLTAAALAVLLICCGPLTGRVKGESPAPPPSAAPAVPPEQMNRAIQEVLEHPEFTWRLPRQYTPKPEQEQGWIERMVMSLFKAVRDAAKKMAHWIRMVFEWLQDVWEKLWGHRKVDLRPDLNRVDWMDSLRAASLVLLAVVAATAGVLLWRAWRKRPVRREVQAQGVAAAPDLHDESVLADQLPEDGWLKLAVELLQKGESRLALRALYLAGLAHLGQQGLVSIARYKTNHDYTEELGRRARARQELLRAFGENVGLFDRAWYGRHDVTADMLACFRANLDRIRT